MGKPPNRGRVLTRGNVRHKLTYDETVELSRRRGTCPRDYSHNPLLADTATGSGGRRRRFTVGTRLPVALARRRGPGRGAGVRRCRCRITSARLHQWRHKTPGMRSAQQQLQRLFTVQPSVVCNITSRYKSAIKLMHYTVSKLVSKTWIYRAHNVENNLQCTVSGLRDGDWRVWN